MDRGHILAVVIKHLRRNVSGLDDADIDPERSMTELGAKSLDIVEVVSASMRELGIKMPRRELSKARNIQGLVDLLASAGTVRSPDL
jgi:acyl carrier protein